MNKLLESWKMITGVITGTFATVAVIYGAVTWFQPAEVAKAQHDTIVADAAAERAELLMELESYGESTAAEQKRDKLEAELERVELAIKLYNDRSERRTLTPDEQEELEYLRERRRQIRARLYGENQ